MGRASPIQNTVNGGEMSSLMLGRQDLAKYDSGLYVCLNAIPLTQGAWSRRPGFAFLHQTKFNDKLSRLLPFQYKLTQTYQLEFGAGYIRFFSNHGILVETAQSMTSITQANPGVVTKTSHGYSDGDRLEMISILGMTQLANREVVVTNSTTNTFELYDSDGAKIDTTSYGAFTSGNMAKILEVTTTFTEAELADIRYTQSNDSFYIFHPAHIPQQLTRVSATSWTIADIAFTDGPYDVANTTTTTLTPSATADGPPVAITNCTNNAGLIQVTAASHGLVTNDATYISGVGGTTEANGYWLVTKVDANNFTLQGSAFVNAYTSGGTTDALIKITASSITGINNDTGFQSTDAGRLVRISDGATTPTWGYAEIEFVLSTTEVWATVLSAFAGTSAYTTWRLGVWSDTTGWPTCGTFFEDRLWMAGASEYQQRFDASKTSLYTNFSPSDTDGTVSADNAIAGTLNSNDVNAIKWMTDNGRGLAVGTARAEWLVSASTLGEALTPTNTTAKRKTHCGSAGLPPITVGEITLFLQRNSRMLRELMYIFQNDGYVANDLTELSSHLTKGGIIDMSFQELTFPVIWCVRTDGELLGFTYELAQNVKAWHRHELGGYSDAAHTAIPIVESICAAPAPDGTRDEAYAIVQRYINGGTKRYVEYMTKPWEEGDLQEDAFFTDCGWTQVDSTASDTITGLWFLEGETLGAYVDGALHPDVTVTNGTVTLNYAGNTKTVGYFYNSDGQSMPINAGAQDGTAQGKIKKVNRLGFWLLDTLGLYYGPDASNLTQELVREFYADKFGQPTQLFTGVIRDRLEGDFDRLGQVYWRANGPFPATVLAIMPQVDVSDDS